MGREILPRTWVNTHRLCGWTNCKLCQQLLSIGSEITRHARGNGVTLTVTDAWFVTATRRSAAYVDTDQYTQVYIVNDHRVTVSSAFYPGDSREYDRDYDEHQHSIHIDREFVGTYVQMLHEVGTGTRLGYEGVLAWAIAKPLLRPEWEKQEAARRQAALQNRRVA